MDLLIPSTAIAQRLQEVGMQIDKQYKNEELVVVMVMKGALVVTADLIRNLHIPVSVEFVRAKSYGKNGTSQGKLTITGLDDFNVKGKNVLIVDDIFDSGTTMKALVNIFKAKKTKSLRSLVLLLKQVPYETGYRPDHVLFEIPNRFVIGYGLDYKESFRELPGIYAFKDDKPPF
jgi:hypoxanthine phosphoribosyltransferase